MRPRHKVHLLLNSVAVYSYITRHKNATRSQSDLRHSYAPDEKSETGTLLKIYRATK